MKVAGALLRRTAEEPEAAELLIAPWDDEPVTEEDQLAVREALEEPSMTLERARRELLG